MEPFAADNPEHEPNRAPGGARHASPSPAAQIPSPEVTRRRFLSLMSASLALAGLNGCINRRPIGAIVPRPRQPEETVEGSPVFFATAMPFDGYARGVLALSREGRPVKIEGNPDHPASLGGTDVFMQASVLDLYDPDRAQTTTLGGLSRQTGDFFQALRQRLDTYRGNGKGLRLLTRSTTSPTLAAQIDEFRRRFPGAVWHCYDPVHQPGGSDPGIFSEPVDAIYDFTKAGTILSLDCDFLFAEPGSPRYARHFIDGRRVREGRKEMNRLYVAESTLTLTGSMADHRLPLAPSRIQSLAMALASALGASTRPAEPNPPEDVRHWASIAADDLSHPPSGRSGLVLAGRSQPPEVHALTLAINAKLGSVGKTVAYIDPVATQGAQSLSQLVQEIQRGEVQTLLILDGNPAYDAPADIPFADALKSLSIAMRDGQYANLTAHLALIPNETSYLCQWVIPQAHWLESWGDVRAFDGTASIIQPLIAPLYGGLTPWELMETVLGHDTRGGMEIIERHWMQHVSGDFRTWWVHTLQTGIVENSAFQHRSPPAVRQEAMRAAPSAKPIEVLFQPDPSLWNGDFASNAWLQELPKPFTKLTWDNAILINLQMAKTLDGERGMLHDGDMVRLRYRGRELRAPVMILPGQADGVVTLHLGYGRQRGGRLLMEDGQPLGYNAYLLRTSDAPWTGQGAELSPTSDRHLLVVTRNHNALAALPGMPGIAPWLKPQVIAMPGMSRMELAFANRKLIRTASLDYYRTHPRFVDELAPETQPPLTDLYEGAWPYDWRLQWGMVIDQTACIGCNACVIACQAENNIAVVGRLQVSNEREMHWLRIDDYFGGPADNPTVYHQPVPCMHCENAPCEVVCPVGATAHSAEGVNEMTYNRCVGTRFCSNNCPYKVRRFNFLLFSDFSHGSRSLQYNPDVSVRSRGVMEKCTYCIQRIARTRWEMERLAVELQELARQAPTETQRQQLMTQADEHSRQIVRTLQTACQQACPTRAIIFGNIRDPASDVSRCKSEPTNYVLLKHLTTRPRTSYLARITNPNPKLSEEHA